MTRINIAREEQQKRCSLQVSFLVECYI